MPNNQIAYIHDVGLLQECDRLPMVKKRASMVHDLISSYDLLKAKNIFVKKSIPATEDELRTFHSSDYINYIKRANNKNAEDEEFEDLAEFGLVDDCFLLDRCYDFIRFIGGSSLTAAKILIEQGCHRVINWFGGWHHAQRDKAEGFCYVNDIVICIQYLTQKFKRILYIDLDVHHGDGVESAFEFSRNILTLSFHKYSPGFYPNTGALEDIGKSRGKYFSVNVPLLDYVSDENYVYVFKSIFKNIYESFQPEVMVVQCGADIVTGDAIGECNVTIESLGDCIQDILNKELPTIFLGGGGYNLPNTARYWTYLTALITNTNISNDIPDTSEFFTQYTPSYELSIQKSMVRDKNTKGYLDNIISEVEQYGQIIEKVRHVTLNGLS